MQNLQPKTLLIFTVGKVGSATVYLTCEQDPRYKVYHMHHVIPEGTPIPPDYKNNPNFHEHDIAAIEVMQQCLISKEVKIINLVRDPIARCISHFFNNHPELYSHLSSANDLNINEYLNAYMKHAPHQEPFVWTNVQLGQVLKQNPYHFPFDTSAGASITVQENISLLTMQCELDNNKKLEAFNAFLDTNFTHFIPYNETAQGTYKEIYQKIISELPLPHDYIDSMYKTEYCSHYYTRAQLETFRNKWLRR